MEIKILAMGVLLIMIGSTFMVSANINHNDDLENAANCSSIDVCSLGVDKKDTCTVGWELLTEGFGNDCNFATRGIDIYNDELYIGTDNFNQSKKIQFQDVMEFLRNGLKRRNFEGWEQLRYSLKSDGCEIWKYNDDTQELHQIVGNLPEADIESGFGNPMNSLASFIIEFKGKLYVGTDSNVLVGCDVWRYDGSTWELVVTGGFGDVCNDGAHSAKVYNDHLYVGTMNWNKSKTGFCQIWRSFDGENWTKVVDKGFRDLDTTKRTNNRYAWCMTVFNNELYVGTYNHPALLHHKGGQLWKTDDGVNWSKVELTGGDGFGESRNHGIRNMEVFENLLFVGVASMGPNGLEIWKYNGDIWIPEIGDDVPGVKFKPWHKRNDGFGDRSNDYPYSMTVTSDNKLWVGTVNAVKGAEIYRYNGLNWDQIVGDDEDSEAANGFGVSANVGVRSMIEYPIGSGNMFVGTATSFANPSVCQIWMRKGT